MSEQAPLAIREESFSRANAVAAVQHHALCLDASCFWRNGLGQTTVEFKISLIRGQPSRQRAASGEE